MCRNLRGHIRSGEPAWFDFHAQLNLHMRVNKMFISYFTLTVAYSSCKFLCKKLLSIRPRIYAGMELGLSYTNNEGKLSWSRSNYSSLMKCMPASNNLKSEFGLILEVVVQWVPVHYCTIAMQTKNLIRFKCMIGKGEWWMR